MYALFGLFLAGSIVFDWYWIEKRKKPISNHRPRFILRAVVALLLSAGQRGFTLPALATAIHLAALWWLLFDVILNLARGRNWNYVGKSARLDRTFGSFAGQLAAKLLLLLGSTIAVLYFKMR